ncbi:hypothetical protein [Candidatus Cardinium hertigii]|uniref:hypothetical protein n=1 Tax=Candidatus Cardinium hertigii TaxID=247481 RepID=UPI003D7D2B81
MNSRKRIHSSSEFERLNTNAKRKKNFIAWDKVSIAFNKELFQAIEENNIKKVKNLLDNINNLLKDNVKYKYFKELSSMNKFLKTFFLKKNENGETPLFLAMIKSNKKKSNKTLLEYVVSFTHEYVGLNLTQHTNKEEDDFFDIALKKITEPTCCSYPLEVLIDEMLNCNPRTCDGLFEHYNPDKCEHKKMTKSIINDPKKLKLFFKQVHNNKIEFVHIMLSSMLMHLGPNDCLELLHKKCFDICDELNEYLYTDNKDYKPYYTIFHCALDKNVLDKYDKITVEYLFDFLLFILKSVSFSFKHEIKENLINILFKSIDEYQESIPELMKIAEEYKCNDAVLNFHEANRIIELDSTEGQFYKLDLDVQ